MARYPQRRRERLDSVPQGGIEGRGVWGTELSGNRVDTGQSLATVRRHRRRRSRVLGEQGAGLLPAAIVARDVAAGRLVKRADIVWPEEFAYYLVYPDAFHERPKVAAFRSWLMSAAGTSSAHAADEPPGAAAAPAPVRRPRSRSR